MAPVDDPLGPGPGLQDTYDRGNPIRQKRDPVILRAGAAGAAGVRALPGKTNAENWKRVLDAKEC